MSVSHAQVLYSTILEASHHGELGSATYRFPLPNACTLSIGWESIDKFRSNKLTRKISQQREHR